MSSISSLPFEKAHQAAGTLSDPLIKSRLLATLAQQQLLTEQFDAALQTFAAIPVPQERRAALQIADFHSFPPEKVESLVQLLKADDQTNSIAGQIALSMMEAKNAAFSWKLIEITDYSFESEQQRYDFLERALPQLQEGDWEKVLRLYPTFKTEMKRDWALLAMVKRLVDQQRHAEAEEFADSIALPLRRSWVYWEMSRLTTKEQSELYFAKAIEIIEAIEMKSDDEETMEKLAIQLRIFGRITFKKNRNDLGEHLLERSEAIAASLTMPMQRYRLQCFLGKVLVELKMITSIKEYLAIDTMLESLRSGLERSRVSVWLAEAGWTEGWTKAIEFLSVPERGTTELERSHQIADVLNRFVAHHRGEATGEELETRSFSPFAEAECGC